MRSDHIAAQHAQTGSKSLHHQPHQNHTDKGLWTITMFKSAATKIAHNTTIPALAGHSDLRPLQDLITAEKTVLTSLQKLRVDLVKAGDALRIWGQGEGDDLSDILAASSTILTHFATALSTYSSLHHAVRDSMKSVRTREEALDELRRRRRRVGASAEAAEKKLHKMSPEHKNLTIQMDTLNKLRDEMHTLDGEIVREEAELGDYKRKCTKDWMGFKFGGLVECCEKGVIVGDIGRQIIQSIPEDITQPGLPRAYYNGHRRVDDLVVEAERAVSQVTFSVNSRWVWPRTTRHQAHLRYVP
ncbi:Eisosome component PIL1/LSP1 [Boletus coccyginus]|nr:Eisosome component PIL1/LSP1 [Boletus coccyginus]